MGKPRTIATGDYADEHPSRVHVFRTRYGRWRVFRGHRAVDYRHVEGEWPGYATHAEAMRRADREARR